MARWIVAVVVAGIVVGGVAGCGRTPPTPPSTGGYQTPVATGGTEARATPPLVETQPVQRLPMPVARTPMPTAAGPGGQPRVALLATPWPFMSDAAFGDAARADLAGRLKVTPDAVEVVSVVRDQFPIGVFNCTQRRTPDKAPYTQPALVNAVEIVLRAGGRQYTYYAQGQRLTTCDTP